MDQTQAKSYVVYWNNMPSPYLVGRLNALAARGNLRVEAWFNVEREEDRSWDVDPEEWLFDARYIPATVILGRRFHVPIVELKETRPHVIISLYESPSFLLGILASTILARRSAIRVLPTFDTWVRRTRLKEAMKHVLFRAIDAAKVPGPAGAAVAIRYGLSQSRIYPVTQSIDVEHYKRARSVSSEHRLGERRKRGLGGCVFIYAGRLWKGKGLDTLFSAYSLLRHKHDNVSLLIVGDGIDEQEYRTRTQGLNGVHFEGFVQPSRLPSLYALADVFVFPTLGDPHGLVIEEAMAAGLPVISSESAGDIRMRIPNEKVGIVVPPGDSVALADAMQRLSAQPQLRRQMAVEGGRMVEFLSHERYAIDFEYFVERTLMGKTRRTACAILLKLAGVILIGLFPSRGTAPLISSRD